MADLLDKSRIELKIGDYGTAPASALADPLLLQRVQGYRRMTGARMMALDVEGVERKLPAGEYHISRKIDGEFTVLIYDNGQIITLNPGGTVRLGLPFLEEAAGRLKQAGIERAMIAGELYVKRPDGKRERIHDVVRIARRPEKAKDIDTLQYAVFDYLEIDGEEAPAQYETVRARLADIFDGGDRVNPVEYKSGKGAKDVLALFDQWVETEGSEGLVARSDTAGMFKVKPRHTLDVAVIGFAEGTDERAGMLHDMLIAIVRSDGNFQVLGRVGGGFTDEQRTNFLSDLRDLATESEYAEVNSDRVAYQMVRPEWVIEISCLDLIAETTRGATIDRMVLTWNSKESKWETVRRLPLVSIISPQFVRIRDDKSATPEDVRMAQLTDIVAIKAADRTAEDLALPKSEMLKREVVTKTLRGGTMVRKLTMWKTNKEDQSDDFPAFVVHLTDFSPNRKDPLKREIRVSSSKDQCVQLWEALKTKFFVGGWNPPE